MGLKGFGRKRERGWAGNKSHFGWDLGNSPCSKWDWEKQTELDWINPNFGLKFLGFGAVPGLGHPKGAGLG